MGLHDQLLGIYDIFNEELFENILGDKIDNTLITLQRKNGIFGYMLPERFASNTNNVKLNEIALNIEYFGFWPRIHLLQNLAHQMMHCYQFQHGEVSKQGSHDEQFHDFMLTIGLQTTDSGTFGGKPIGGRKVFNYPLPDGAFLEVCNEIANSELLPEWFELEKPKSYGLQTIMQNVLHIKDQLPDDVNPQLLEVPFFKLNKIDPTALIESGDLDEKGQVVIDAVKASKIAEKAIKDNRASFDTPMQLPSHIPPVHEPYKPPAAPEKITFFDEVQAMRKAHFEKVNSELDPDDEELPADTAQEIKSRMPGWSDFTDTAIPDIKLDQVTQQSSDYTFDDANDDAAKFLAKNSLKTTSVNSNESPVVVKSLDQIASILGLPSADDPKAPEKKKSKYAYSCSCGNKVWGPLSLNLICGKCQLTYKCETLEIEVDIVNNT